MPKISLVVCLYKERDLLERLLQHAEGCYDDLVVVHDRVKEEVSAEDRRQKIGDGSRDAAEMEGTLRPELGDGGAAMRQKMGDRRLEMEEGLPKLQTTIYWLQPSISNLPYPRYGGHFIKIFEKLLKG